MPDILIYQPLYSYSAEYLIRQMDLAAQAGEEITCRINCDGGEPASGYGVIAKFNEFEGAKRIKVDGKAYSMAAFFLCYCQEAEALDVSEFILHRAAYSQWFESSEYFTAEAKASLMKTNKNLRKALEAKIDVAKFEQMKGVTLDQLFSLDSRIDVTLTAQEAKKIGLISKIVTLTPAKRAEINGYVGQIAAQYQPAAADTPPTPDPVNKPVPVPTNKKMTLAELKTSHPELYAQVVKDAQDAERDRINAWMVYADIDLEGVKKGIEEGKPLSAAAMADYNRKAVAAASLTKLET
jgi:ATP-dependent protease ClpP protease subunit